MFLMQVMKRPEKDIDNILKLLDADINKFAEKGKDPVFCYIDKKLKQYYGTAYNSPKYPDMKRRVDSFLNWIKNNDSLLEAFKKDLEGGKIYVVGQFDNQYMDKRYIMGMFGFWIGAAYITEKELGTKTAQWAKMHDSFGYSTGSTDIEARTLEFRPSVSLGSSLILSWIDGFNVGVHEGTHMLKNKDKGLGESATVVQADRYLLPLRISTTKPSEAFVISSRRNFYDIYTKVVNGKIPGLKLDKLVREYTEYAVFPWLKPKIGDSKLIDMDQRISDYEDFRDLIVWTLSEKAPDPKTLAEHICQAFRIEDEETKEKLCSVLSELRETNKDIANKYKNKKDTIMQKDLNARDWTKAIKRFVETMSKYFGKPDLEIWDDFVYKKTKTTKGTKNEFLG